MRDRGLTEETHRENSSRGQTEETAAGDSSRGQQRVAGHLSELPEASRYSLGWNWTTLTAAV